MLRLSFDSYPLWLNALIFLLAATTIWFTGVRLERYAGTISERTGLGQAFTGMLFLSISTSLPEIATVTTAILILNDPVLAVHNVLGAVALQTAVLAAADRAKRRRGSLTFFSPHFVLMVEGVGLLVLLQLTIAGVAARGFPSVVSVGIWPALVFLTYLVVMYMTYRYRDDARWIPSRSEEVPQEGGSEPGLAGAEGESPGDHPSMRRVWLLFCGASLIVLVGGWTVAQSVDALAEQTGLGPAFLGATLLALAGSLPELSTTVAASRNGRYSMAMSNIFGSNSFDISLLFLADLLYRGGSILAHAEWSVVFVAAIGTAMTCIYLWGLMERENRTLLGVGLDSAAVLVIYLGTMSILYFMT